VRGADEGFTKGGARPIAPVAAFSAVAVGVFMATLDGSIVNVALPSIRHDLGASIQGASLVVSAYLLAVSVTLLAAGRLGDAVGLRRVYVGGMLLFAAGSLLCGLSRTLSLLVAARVVQALGAAAMMAIGPAAVTAVFPRERRGRALGGISTVVAVGLTAGPPIGGFIVSYFSWPGIFFVNLPVGVAGAVWATRALPGRMRASTPSPSHEGEGRGEGSLLRDRVVTLGLAAGLLSYAGLFTQTLLSPFYLSQVKSLGAGGLGAMLTAVPLALSVTSPVGGWLADRFGPRGPCLVGSLLLAAGLLSLSLAGADDSLASFAARLALEGAGMGLFQPPNNSAIMGALPRERLGSGGGLLATARTVGMVAGVALGTALFTVGSGVALPRDGAVLDAGATRAFLAGWRLALSAGAGLAVVAGVLSLARSRPRASGA
jgi:MFS family permease